MVLWQMQGQQCRYPHLELQLGGGGGGGGGGDDGGDEQPFELVQLLLCDGGFFPARLWMPSSHLDLRHQSILHPRPGADLGHCLTLQGAVKLRAKLEKLMLMLRAAQSCYYQTSLLYQDGLILRYLDKTDPDPLAAMKSACQLKLYVSREQGRWARVNA